MSGATNMPIIGMLAGALLLAPPANAAVPDGRIRVMAWGTARATDGTPPVRPPRIVEPAGGALPAEAMPRVLAQGGGAVIAWVHASLTIAADGTPTDCRPVAAQATQGGGYRFAPADPVLGLETCDLVRARVKFAHAIDEAGRATAAVIDVRVQFEQGDARLPPAPPPPATLGPGLGRTSGHVIDAAGHLLGSTWIMADYAINPPDWAAALTDRRKLPKAAMVGVLVDLRPRDGRHVVENCTVARSSGDARLDAATCAALVAAGYDASRVRYASPYGVDRFPVKVDWADGQAAMTVLPPVEVPHMPKDVVLVAGDLAGTAAPAGTSVEIELRLAAGGKVVGCAVTRSSEDDGRDAASCRLARERARFTSPLDWFGTPSPGTYEAVVDWERMVIRPRW